MTNKRPPKWRRRAQPRKNLRPPANPDRQVHAQTLCSECQKPLFEHRRCALCKRFVWCTAIAKDDRFNFRHVKCPAA